MALALLSIVSLAAAQLATKAIPFGQRLPVMILSPAPVIEASNESRSSETLGFVGHDEIIDGTGTRTFDNEDLNRPHIGSYVPYEITEDMTLVRPYSGLVARAPAYRGTCKWNCKSSPEACKNACYYQNCIMAGQKVYYYEPAPKSAGRNQAGVSITMGTPCQTSPFGQKFWDSRENGSTTNLKLQTDEWPMFSQQRANFDPTATTPQVALRCINNRDNSRGGNIIRYFREGSGDWNSGGRFVSDRLGNSQKFRTGDWYDVEFFLDDFDRNDAAQAAIYNSLTYCHPQPNCANDGLQFHLTSLKRKTPNAVKGLVEQPYDNALHNTYRITGEPADIRQFHIDLDITGQANDRVSARVYVFNNGQERILASRASTAMARGTSFTIPASITLPKAIRVSRPTTNSCMDFIFNYGNANTDRFRHYNFNSSNIGWPAATRWGDKKGKYCTTESIPDPNRKGKNGSRLKCAFPAW
ncbi:hypothetical protein CKM354_000981000 [Cercospora kikuchii]|uniref:Uncharacterized protein n=1 Tax=Cercospora kikuchii TaxID=84275 RepID=A0A9P3CY76_9PEZI|nr:uncharacterized protein CKM354_000981000 [Cercospora kikuchii]GIZ46693.1 hypothetical protein CKM354_000981000 [Cercospora kikuchii]